MTKTTTDPRPEYYFSLIQDLKTGGFDPLKNNCITSRKSGRCYTLVQLLETLQWMMEERDAWRIKHDLGFQMELQTLTGRGWTPPAHASVSAKFPPPGFNTIMRIDATGAQGEQPRDIKITAKETDDTLDAHGLVRDWRMPGGVRAAPHDPVNSPSHYTDGGIEVIDYLEAKLSRQEFIGFLRGNVLKYFSRAGKKQDALEDFKKGDWYAERLVKTLTTGEQK